MPHPKASIINYHHKQVKHIDNISVYQKPFQFDLLASMKTFLIHQNPPILWESVTKIIETHYIFI